LSVFNEGIFAIYRIMPLYKEYWCNESNESESNEKRI